MHISIPLVIHVPVCPGRLVPGTSIDCFLKSALGGNGSGIWGRGIVTVTGRVKGVVVIYGVEV